MITLQLDPREADTLADVLRSYLSELVTEVSHTDRPDYRKGLKEQENVIKDIQEKLARASS